VNCLPPVKIIVKLNDYDLIFRQCARKNEEEKKKKKIY